MSVAAVPPHRARRYVQLALKDAGHRLPVYALDDLITRWAGHRAAVTGLSAREVLSGAGDGELGRLASSTLHEVRRDPRSRPAKGHLRVVLEEPDEEEMF